MGLRTTRHTGARTSVLAGVALLLVGVGLVSVAAALILVGVALLLVGLLAIDVDGGGGK